MCSLPPTFHGKDDIKLVGRLSVKPVRFWWSSRLRSTFDDRKRKKIIVAPIRRSYLITKEILVVGRCCFTFDANNAISRIMNRKDWLLCVTLVAIITRKEICGDENVSDAIRSLREQVNALLDHRQQDYNALEASLKRAIEKNTELFVLKNEIKQLR